MPRRVTIIWKTLIIPVFSLSSSTIIFVALFAVIAYYFVPQKYANLKPEKYFLPQPPKLEGPLSPNQKLTNAIYILKGEIKGPESLYIHGRDIDTIYTGTADAKVVKIVNEKIAKEFVLLPENRKGIECDGSFESQPKCGRPMGIKKFDETRLIVADAYFGIFLVDLELDIAEHILKPSTIDQKNRVKCAFFNDIAILDNDTIIFSCSSTRWGVGLAFHMLLEHNNDGKVYQYKLSTKEAKVIAENFSFCNGIELNQNKTALFIAETGMARIWKLPLSSGTNAKPEIFIENLPALPDNIRATSSGSYLVGLAVHRSGSYFSIFDFMGPRPWLRQLFIELIPESFINKCMPKMTTKYGFVIELDENGKIIDTFQDPTGNIVNYISEAVETEGILYLGSFKDDYIAKAKNVQMDETNIDNHLPNSMCPTYKEVLTKMRASLDSENKKKKKIEILINFSNKYLMIPQYWKMLIDLCEEKYGRYDKRTLRLMKKGRSHFYALEEWQQMPAYFIKEFHIKWSYLSPFYMNIGLADAILYSSLINRLKELITFPHQYLKEIFEILEFNGPSPVTNEMKQAYQNSLKLYQKFIEAGENDDQWLECLNEVKIDKAIIDNIELRLGEGQNYANQKIWKFYINFMKSKNSSDLLKIYDRYCRLFISDNQVKREYLMLKYYQFLKVWKDKMKKKKIFTIPKWLKPVEKKPQKIYFQDSGKAKNQSMAFRSPLMHYITESAKAPILHKLHKTCKYFFNQRPYPVCHRLVVGGSWSHKSKPLYYIEQALFIKPNAFYGSKLKNLYLSQDVILEGYNSDKTQKNISSKIYKSEATSIRFSESNLHIKDLECFIKSGAIKYFNMQLTTITNENGHQMENEEIRDLLKLHGNVVEYFW